MNKFNRKIISIVLVILTILAMFMLEKFTDENKSDKERGSPFIASILPDRLQ